MFQLYNPTTAKAHLQISTCFFKRVDNEIGAEIAIQVMLELWQMGVSLATLQFIKRSGVLGAKTGKKVAEEPAEEQAGETTTA